MFTAIVLNDAAFGALMRAVHSLGLYTAEGGTPHAHHCTLNLGPAKDKSKLGSIRKLTVTGYGHTFGRVLAFRVAGAEDSKNKVPHVTVFTFGDAKPKESNEIREWHDVEPFEIFGEVREVR